MSCLFDKTRNKHYTWKYIFIENRTNQTIKKTENKDVAKVRPSPINNAKTNANFSYRVTKHKSESWSKSREERQLQTHLTHLPPPSVSEQFLHKSFFKYIWMVFEALAAVLKIAKAVKDGIFSYSVDGCKL